MNESTWDVAQIVAQLRSIREASLIARRRVGRPAKLPSRRSISEIVEGLSAALFPNRLGRRELAAESVDYFVGRTLDVTLLELESQIALEWQFGKDADGSDGAAAVGEARRIVASFADQLPEIRERLEADIQAAHQRDPSARSIDEVVVICPGVTALVHHRLAHALDRLGAPLVARMIAALAHSLTGIDIHPAARIGEGCSMNQGTGIVIGETVVVGRQVWLHHGVTLGDLGHFEAREHAAREDGIRHPRLEDEVVVYAGATILGPVTIGRGSIIGGNVWLTRSVPPASHITQALAQFEDFDAGSGI